MREYGWWVHDFKILRISCTSFSSNLENYQCINLTYLYTVYLKIHISYMVNSYLYQLKKIG